YADEPGGRAIRSSHSGAPWNIEGGGGDRTVRKGFYFVQDTDVPGGDIEHPDSDAREADYRLDWSCDEDSVYTLAWSDRNGQVIQSAQGSNSTQWAVSRVNYYPNGKPRQALTPLDAQENDTLFGEITNYNAAGQLISSYTSDRGLDKQWYDKQGQVRYTQNAV